MDGDHTMHARHRRETVKYMRDHKSDFEPFMEDNVSFDKHCKCDMKTVFFDNRLILKGIE